MNPLPPQAYTKDTLLKAYQWLMSQNSSIKEMATTPDILVSLFLKATRDGDHALERPSIKNFKNELKSLAGMMGELDRPTQPPIQPQAPVQMQQHVPAQHVPVQHAPVQHVHVQQAPVQMAIPVQTAYVQQPVAVHAPVPTQTQVSYTEKTMTAMTRNSDISELLDPASHEMIQEVKEAFNLSSDLEVLRMLIKIGYTRARGLTK
ncbi:hypothetical protein [Bdellovibrio reynosensis]|uniref:Uncharacterized protein n=1 Tax=Bdellovibrio reynosensis TaxID=2835041 RepID=A0ABY4CFB4_9BACT|nr:hypothetical protein [Bdellovibrio reynosensis]UOF00895.1 hypothetical protein MNR06_14430 [Bdellovibrio reynosensis]